MTSIRTGAGKTVLVTGATGFVGRYLCPLLLLRGYQVRGVHRDEHRPRDFPSAMEWIGVPDVGPDTEWTAALDGVTHVVHLAGLAHRFGIRGQSPQDDFWKVNHLGTERLARAAQAMGGVRRLIFLSSVGAVCSLSDEVVRHDTPAHPDTPYGKSKKAGEEALERVLASGCPDWTVIRSPLVYGPGNPGNMGRLLRLIDRGIPLPLASVENRRSFVFVGNLADLLERSLEHADASRKTFLVSDGVDLSTAELVRRLGLHAKRPIRIFPMPGGMLRVLGRVGDTVGTAIDRSVGLNTYSVERLLGSLAVDSHRVRNTLDWTNPFTMEEGLAQTLGAREPAFPELDPAAWSVHWRKGVTFDAVRPEAGPPVGGKTLVTGASGFVARHVMKSMAAAGVPIRGLVRSAAGSAAVPGGEFALGDLLDPVSLDRALEGVDTVIHLAARAHVLDEREPNGRDAFFRVNVEGTRNLLDAALCRGVDRFLFLSSVKALGEGGERERWTDDTPARPTEPYGESKLAAERLIRARTGGTSLHAPILRFPIVYGPGVKANILRLFELVSARVPLPLGRVNNLRSLLYVENAVAAMEAALDTPDAGRSTYLVSDIEDVSTPMLVRKIGKVLGRTARLVPVPVMVFQMGGKAGDVTAPFLRTPLNSGVVERLVGSLVVDPAPFVEATGFDPPFSLHEGLRRTARWFVNRDRG